MSKEEKQALELYPVVERMNKRGTGVYDANLPRRKAWLEGYAIGHKNGYIEGIEV